MQKLLVTGPESTGKSTLCKALASHYETSWVPEFARLWLEEQGPDYREQDLLEIAEGQLLLEDFHTLLANKYLFCDTGMLVMKVWAQFKYGRCHPWIERQWQQRHYDHILLCSIDIPWEPGAFRENPRERAELYALYKGELEASGKFFTELSGTLEERLEKVCKILDSL